MKGQLLEVNDNLKSNPQLVTEKVFIIKKEWNCKVPSHLAVFEASRFVWIKVLQHSQPDGVMSSTVSLSNHTFTGQA